MTGLDKLKELDRKINYERLFFIAALCFHAFGLMFLLTQFYAYTLMLGFSETWPKLQFVPMFIFIALFGANGLKEKKPLRFVSATLTNFIIMFTF